VGRRHDSREAPARGARMQVSNMNKDTDQPPLSEQEAEVAGLVKGRAVYGDSSVEPNEDDHADAERAGEDEHV
jgi:hypothetical protein